MVPTLHTFLCDDSLFIKWDPPAIYLHVSKGSHHVSLKPDARAPIIEADSVGRESKKRKRKEKMNAVQRLPAQSRQIIIKTPPNKKCNKTAMLAKSIITFI